MLFELFSCHADGRWYLDGRDAGKDAARAIESYFGRPLTSYGLTRQGYSVGKLAGGRVVRAIQVANEDAFAGHSGRVRLPENVKVATPPQRCPASRESVTERLPEGCLLPDAWKESKRDRLAAKVALARAGLGVNPGDVPVGATAITVGAPGGRSPARETVYPVPRSDSRDCRALGTGDPEWNRPKTVEYDARPDAAVIPRELDSLVRQVALSRARRITRREAR